MKRTLAAAIMLLTLFSSAYGQKSAAAKAAETTYVPLTGGTMTGPLYNQYSITAKLVGSLLQADQFAGGDASAKINACLVAANAGGGGVCDARMFTGSWKMNETVEILSKTTLLLPHWAQWCWAMTDGVSVGIQQDSSSQLIGNAVGGGGNTMLLLPCNASTHMLALYATQNNPVSGGQYIYATGFNAQNLIGATFAKGVVYTRYLFDESRFERIAAINNSGDAWHVYSSCCDTNFQEVQASSTYGATGGTPLVVEGQSSFSWSGTINSAGTGHPNIDIQNGNYQLDFWNLYSETGGPTADLSTPVVNIAGSPIVRFHGGIAALDSTKACFNSPALVTFNNNWCNNSALPAEGVACPNNNAIYGTDSTHLYVCAGNRVKSMLLQ